MYLPCSIVFCPNVLWIGVFEDQVPGVETCNSSGFHHIKHVVFADHFPVFSTNGINLKYFIMRIEAVSSLKGKNTP